MNYPDITGLLQDKVVVLVGVGNPGDTLSNGRATALAFAKAGTRLVLADRSKEALDACLEAVAPVAKAVRAVECDATSESDVEALFATALAEFGTVDVLHNNLGIASVSRMTKTTLENFDRVVSVNLKSVFLLCKHALRVMEEKQSGVVTNVSSISSIRHLGIASPLYDMTKAGLNGLTRSIAVDYGPKGIRANSILVGMMDTPLARGGIEQAGRDIDQIYDGYIKRIPLRRMGTGNDTGHLAVFLASELSSYINGAELVLDGGLTVKSG